MFQVGQRVQCVHDGAWVTPDGERHDAPAPKRALDYVVSGVRDGEGGVFLELEELPPRFAYHSECFRPLAEPELERLRALAAHPPARASEVFRRGAR